MWVSTVLVFNDLQLQCLICVRRSHYNLILTKFWFPIPSSEWKVQISESYTLILHMKNWDPENDFPRVILLLVIKLWFFESQFSAISTRLCRFSPLTLNLWMSKESYQFKLKLKTAYTLQFVLGWNFLRKWAENDPEF